VGGSNMIIIKIVLSPFICLVLVLLTLLVTFDVNRNQVIQRLIDYVSAWIHLYLFGFVSNAQIFLIYIFE
jgi:hypothetical protein